MLIIFDLDDTLIDTSGTITPIKLELALRKMVDAGMKVGDFGVALQTLKRIDLAAESASQSLLEFVELIDADKHFFEIGEKEVYGPLNATIPIFPLDDVIEVLEELREIHQLALVSKGDRDQQLFKMKSAGIDSTIFSKIIISEKGEKKVDYKTILDELAVSPSQTVVCGDRVRRDLTPAKELGCTTVLMKWGRGLNAPKSDDVDHTIKKIDEIRQIIKNVSERVV